MVAELPKKRKICILGSRSVGKSSLIIQFTENIFTDAYYPTIENTFSKTLKYNGVEYECDIIDTAGQDEYSVLQSKHAVGIHGYMLVYSVADRQSFQMIQTVHEKILNYTGGTKIPCVVVGQKSDVGGSSSPLPRQVTMHEGEELAKKMEAAFLETSARQNSNVAKVFDVMLNEMEKSKSPQKEEGHRCVFM
jgi:Ras family protein